MIRIVALFDNEEVGSTTAHGADSNFLEVTLKRLSALPFGSSQVSIICQRCVLQSVTFPKTSHFRGNRRRLDYINPQGIIF